MRPLVFGIFFYQAGFISLPFNVHILFNSQR